MDVSISASNYVNRWCHIVASYSSGDKSVYLNGSLLQNSTSITGTLVKGTATHYIGSSSGGSEFFKGNYSIFKMYNRRLSADEILQNYNATKSRFII